ncbi:restriction endonuclease subunit S [Vibrio cholerae]|uniref:restriction endonuclease subunit S n=1 Tax=Vibrio cholerae TaxID=666 RepID=UPI001E5C124C|nr:restriction endonuclease subunit S [Vibrio cholerae]MCD1191181.1 hypothetical protein [Vibrio cholerae]MEB5516630.1 restriction endonuclease subunit S [Vibrio cholerae]
MGFEMGTLGDYIKVQGGFAYKSKDFQDSGANKVLKIKNVRFGHVDYGDTAYISDTLAKETQAWSTNEGDILISMTGSGPNAPQSLVGRVARVWENEDKAWINQRVGRIVLRKENTINPDFVYYLLSQKSSQDFLVSNSSGSANQANISGKTIEMLPCPIVSFEESSRIASTLIALDKKILLNRQINQTLEQMAQTLFKSWFVDFDPVIDNALDAGNPIPDELQHRAEARQAVRESEGFNPLPDDVRQLFPDAFEECELGWVPKGWVYQSFGSLLASTIGGDWGKDVQDEKHTVQSRIVRGTDIPDLISGQLSSAPLRWVEPKKLKSRQIERGDIIIEVSGGSPKQPTGRSIFMTDSMLARLGSIIEPASFCRRFKPSSFNIGLLASLHLQKIYADGKTWEYQNQSTGIANFQTKFFLEAEMVLIPSEPVLEAFCRIVTPLVEKSQNNEQIALAKLRDTLLPKLISGELRLDDVEAAVEQETVSAEQQNER